MNHQGYHIIFNEDFFTERRQKFNSHYSWNLQPEPDLNFHFGGKLTDSLNRLFFIDKVLEINGSNIERVDFGINFELFFNAQINGKHLFYQHNENGETTALFDDIKIECPYSNYPIKETSIQLAITPDKLKNQEWIGNCNKIGGQPIWVQEPETLECPLCKRPMNFLFQLNSGLPDLNEQNDNEIMFGNDGILYAFWCEYDKVSGYLWQCT